MVFSNPLFLIALVALAIPVLIHLFNFRRYKKLYFTNVRFLSAIKQETRKRSELRQLLILLSRLLAIACLVLAFAQPYIPSPLQQKKRTGQQIVSVYIDNSFSMESINGKGSLLDVAKMKALEIASACQPSDQFLLITNDINVRENIPVSREEFTDMVKEVELSPVSVPLSSVLLREKETVRNLHPGGHTIYLLSDFQKTTADLSSLPPDTVANYFFLPLTPGKRNNVYIDTAWFESPVQQPGQPSVLKVIIQNAGEEDVEKIPVKLIIDGKLKSVSAVSLEAGARAEIPMTFTNESGKTALGNVEITDNPVIFDNDLYFSFSPVWSLPVLAIHGGDDSPYLNAAFGADSTFILTNVQEKRIDYSSLQRYPVILLDGLKEISSGLSQELSRYVRNGGSLIIFPARDLNHESYRSFFTAMGLPVFGEGDTAARRVDKIDLESPVFSDVFEKNASGKVVLPENTDLPTAFFHFLLTASGGINGKVLLSLENNDPFLASFTNDRGQIYLFSSPLDPAMTNLPKHPLFVPVMFKLALLSQAQHQLYYYTGTNDPLEIPGDSVPEKESCKIKKSDGTFEFIPEMRNTGASILLFPHNQIQEAGHYLVERNGVPGTGLAFNYHRAESDPLLLTGNEIKTMLSKDGIRYFALLKDNKTPMTTQVSQIMHGKPLIKLFLLLSLLFIATEIAIIRIMR
ncbi:MAG TPA: BatA domain-containing protein [Bacteroidales bacterium]|nr:BatA domain-containing protein [Bacteroidales bacterium]HPS73172.1 BatA domain-containing protein [Bacteroidales bacterium]